MGLFKLALIGGAAYYAGKKFGGGDGHPNGPMNNYDPNQADNWGNNNRWGHGRCGRKRQQQQQQQDTREIATEGVYSDYPSEKKRQPVLNDSAPVEQQQQQQEYDHPPYGWPGYGSAPAQPGYYWYGPGPRDGPNGYTAPAPAAADGRQRTMSSSPRQSTGKEMVKVEAAPVSDDDARVPVNAASLPPYSTAQGGTRGLSPRQRMYPYPYEKEPMI